MLPLVQQYIDEVDYHLRKMHQQNFHVLWEEPTRKGEWCGKFQLVQDLAFVHAVLYHFTQKKTHLKYAKRYLMDFDKGYHFTSLFLGLTYELIQSELSDAEKEEFGKEWVAQVPAQLEHYVQVSKGAYKKWKHVSNHALCACFYADYARHLFPEYAAPYEFERITDVIWECWWRHREFWEQASNYEAFSELFLIAWADLRGMKHIFFKTPSLINMMERNLQIISPNGIPAAYGDSGHIEHALTWVALMERFSLESQKPPYRTAAAKLFDYLQQIQIKNNVQALDAALKENIYNARLIYSMLIHQISWLAYAAYIGKDNPQEPAATFFPEYGLITRLPLYYQLREEDKIQLGKHTLQTQQLALCRINPTTQDTYHLLLSVGRELIHDHADAGSILQFSKNHTVLLGTNGYLQRELLYHHTFFIQPESYPDYPDDHPDRIYMGESTSSGTVESFSPEMGTATMAFIDYQGFPVDLKRTILLSEQGNLLLWDMITAKKSGYIGGPLFHGEKIRKVSSTEFVIRNKLLQSMNTLKGQNPPGELHIDFFSGVTEVVSGRLRIPRVYKDQYKGFPVCHYTKMWKQSYVGRRFVCGKQRLEPGKSYTMVTLMKPS